MSIRAAIFDVYGTLLELGPPPADADARWTRMWNAVFQIEPRLSRLAFSIECSRQVAEHHARAHNRGVLFPEIWWPSIVAAVLPELRHRSRAEIEQFAADAVSLGRTLRIAPETADFLRTLLRKGLVMGIASNSQAYTIQELESLLAPHGLSSTLFHPHLRFWSFENGFSKPNPHVFQILSLRLEALGIGPDATLMIGDRMDNDVEPARKHGWRAWQYGPDPARNWKALASWLKLD